MAFISLEGSSPSRYVSSFAVNSSAIMFPRVSSEEVRAVLSGHVIDATSLCQWESKASPRFPGMTFLPPRKAAALHENGAAAHQSHFAAGVPVIFRSEERRVGKECRLTC